MLAGFNAHVNNEKLKDAQEAEKQAKAKKEAEQDEKKRAENERVAQFKERKKEFDKLFPPQKAANSGGGIIGSLNNKMSYEPEALAMRAAMTYALFPIWVAGGFISQELSWLQASAAYVYEQRPDGKWPPVYPVKENGELDFSQDPQATDEPVDNFTARLNNYVTPPSLTEPFEIAWAHFNSENFGDDSLSLQQKELIRHMAPSHGKSREEFDGAGNNQFFNTKQPTPPRPKAGG